MSDALTATLIVGAIFFVLLYILTLYNRLVATRNKADEAWSGVDVQLKRRRDLVPNLVSTVQAYAAHERQTFETVTEDRVIADAAAVGGPRQAVPAEQRLTRSIGGVLLIAEQYPQLKASQNFLQLQQELSNVENNLAGSRQIYNGNARDYNDRVQSFPSNLVAAPFDFRARPYFEAAPVDRAPTPVSF